MIGDRQTRARLVGLFVAEAEETVAALSALAPQLRASTEAGALAEFGRIAHGLKGASAALGFEDLARGLHDLEELSIGLRGAGPDVAADQHARIGRALEILGEGIARMAASGADGFPADLVGPLLETVAIPKEGASGPTATSTASSSNANSTGAAAERLSVPAEDVDAALRLASSLARSAALLQDALARDGGSHAAAVETMAHRAQGLETLIAALRLLPADAALTGLEHEVASLAAQLGKKVEIVVGRGEVRADRRTLQAARGLMRHLVRNAIDHGIEPPEKRRGAAKTEEGHLAVMLRATESVLRVSVADDGAGFDLPAVRAEMTRRTGDASRIAALRDPEVLRLWALEGGSTRQSTTQISGRGLGLSAVASTALETGGSFEVITASGEGSEVSFSLPLEVYAAEILTVHTAGRRFGLPLHAVERTVHLAAAASAVHDGPAGRTLAVGETILPLERLADVLGVSSDATDRFAVVVRAEAETAALAVEDVGEAIGVVPTTVPGVAQPGGLVTGIARLADGVAVLVLGPRPLLDRARAVRGASRPASPPRAAPGAAREGSPAVTPAGLDVVLAEDSLATREVLRVLLEEHGFRVRLAADGDEALARVRERLPDVLVSDVNMPRRDGLSLTRALRDRPETARLTIVLLTSQDDDATRAAGAAAGADAYLLKSRFNADVLLETLARIGVRAR